MQNGHINGIDFGRRNLVSESDARYKSSATERFSRNSPSRVREPKSVKGSRPGSIPNEKVTSSFTSLQI